MQRSDSMCILHIDQMVVGMTDDGLDPGDTVEAGQAVQDAPVLLIVN